MVDIERILATIYNDFSCTKMVTSHRISIYTVHKSKILDSTNVYKIVMSQVSPYYYQLINIVLYIENIGCFAKPSLSCTKMVTSHRISHLSCMQYQYSDCSQCI